MKLNHPPILESNPISQTVYLYDSISYTIPSISDEDDDGVTLKTNKKLWNMLPRFVTYINGKYKISPTQ